MSAPLPCLLSCKKADCKLCRSRWAGVLLWAALVVWLTAGVLAGFAMALIVVKGPGYSTEPSPAPTTPRPTASATPSPGPTTDPEPAPTTPPTGSTGGSTGG